MLDISGFSWLLEDNDDGRDRSRHFDPVDCKSIEIWQLDSDEFVTHVKSHAPDEIESWIRNSVRCHHPFQHLILIRLIYMARTALRLPPEVCAFCKWKQEQLLFNFSLKYTGSLVAVLIAVPLYLLTLKLSKCALMSSTYHTSTWIRL